MSQRLYDSSFKQVHPVYDIQTLVCFLSITCIIHSDAIFSSPELQAHNVSLYQSSCRLSVCLSACVSKFYLKHHWDGGKAALGFRPDRIGTLVSMTTDSSLRVIMGKCCEHSSAFIFDRIFFILAGSEDIYNISDEFEIRQDRTMNCGVSCP